MCIHLRGSMCIQSINRRYVARDWFCGLKEGPFLTKYSGTVMVSDVDTMVLYSCALAFIWFRKLYQGIP